MSLGITSVFLSVASIVACMRDVETQASACTLIKLDWVNWTGASRCASRCLWAT
ncbi:hypothetical protein PF005_g26003 [Phytophthora fragariae]|uniref:Uncharacterized protein n=1 Tax=Phytophthora fragariae TaxID=53985 RepID=A0A6A4BPB1_9STRA|nr:hypothetical protein PF003_g39265 [Phytophthora fragariae]KAE8927305.1 hypothetical protein PF009_g22523 [Phytophthora fragariae]KAE8973771.1 hypothetical protein PF011_g25118 [Phytophthora fragariae]KAE9082165.1 hypothetical protein PF007_g22377 [Phytophthora fragariae]KAE9089694.1 hypothetical protein PF006_g25300 [Phytophthora fragariae]